MRYWITALLILMAVTAQAAAPYTAIQVRRDTPTNWASYNPVLAAGEVGCEMTGSPARCTAQKVGDGVTAWTGLPYTLKAARGVDGDYSGVTIKADDVIVLGPWVDARAYPTLAAADAAATAAGKLLVISSQWNTVPATLSAAVKILPGGKLNNAGALAINGAFEGADGCFIGAGAVTFAKSSAPSLSPRWWGAKGDGSVLDEDVALNKAFASSKASGIEVRIPAGTYKTSATIRTERPFKGVDGLRVIIRPQGAFPAFDILTCSTGEIGDFTIDYTDVGSANINSNCIGLRLMNESVSAGQQILFTKFKNILVQYGWSAISYNAATDLQGQLYMVSFDHIASNYNKGTGIYLKCTSGTLSVSLTQCSVDAPRPGDGFFNALASTARGYYFYSIANLTLKNCIASRIESDAVGKVAQFSSIHGLSIQSFQHEGTNMTFGGINSGPIAFFACEQVDIDIRCQNMTVNTTGTVIAPYLYFDLNCKNLLVRAINEQAVTVTSGVKNYFVVQTNATPTVRISVLDGNITRDLCSIPTAAIHSRIRFSSESLSLDAERSARRDFAYYATTVAGTATKILDITAFGFTGNPISGLYVVTGTDASNGAKGFVDLVLIGAPAGGAAATAVAISTNNIGGYTYTRTYTTTATELRVNIPTNAAHVNTTGFSMTGNNY